jgi:hypothetical protein
VGSAGRDPAVSVRSCLDLTLSAADCNSAILIYIDGAQETLSGTPVRTNTAIDFTEATPRATVGAGSNSSSTGDKLNADLAHLWLDVGTRIDLLSFAVSAARTLGERREDCLTHRLMRPARSASTLTTNNKS